MNHKLLRIYWYLLSVIALCWVPMPAQAEDMALTFGLPPVDAIASPIPNPLATDPPTASTAAIHTQQPDTPLTMPQTAASPPIQEAAADRSVPLPPPPPRFESAPTAVQVAQAQGVPPQPATSINSNQAADSANLMPWLEFEDTPAPKTASSSNTALPAPPPPHATDYQLDHLFAGGANSLIARVVGSAEGTRTAAGDRTPAYYGHVDPGNGAWNLGSFSYQHGASSPEEADERQLQRLLQQAQQLQQRAQAFGLTLSLKEALNGIDLANQAPMAALERGGYIDWLAEARQLNMPTEEAIVWARTRSFLDPDTQQWNAPGLGNTVHSITQDQERRMRAIARALEVYQQQAPGQVSNGAIAQTPTPVTSPSSDDSENWLERLLNVDL